MSIPANVNPLLLAADEATPSGYQVSRSLRFNSPDSAYLSRTPSVAGNRKTWTWAGWVKPGALGTVRQIFTSRPTSSPYALFYIFSDDKISFADNALNTHTTAAVYRDPSAWYHIQLAVDTTNATASSRVRLWVNGTLQTWASTTAPTQNADGQINTATAHSIGSPQPYASSEYFDGYLAEIHFIDGQALTPSSFTEVSATTGQLIPTAYTGSYGTNGFHLLPFSDNSATTATTLVKDTSGNGNNWTPTNFSVTAGAGNDSLVDIPVSSGTDTGVGGEVTGNYATLNPLDRMTDNPSNGNLEWTVASANHRGIRSTIKFPSSGKWYYEATVGTASGSMAIGVGMATSSATPGYYNTGTWFIVTNSSITAVIRETSNSTISGMSAPQVGDILQVAYDADAGKVWFGKNNVWANGTTGTDGNPAAGTNPTVSGFTADHFPCVTAYQATLNCNFGQRPFAYTAPSGFKALCDTNLPAPVVAKPSTVMDVKLYTGNGSTQTISGLGFSPDLVWIKSRSLTYNHRLNDSVRGVQKMLLSNTTDAEITSTLNDRFTSFDATGFTLGAADSSNGDGMNQSGVSYVAWAWDAGSSTVTNTQGSITSSVRANASAGFSIVTYTGNLSSSGTSTVGHGLGVAPKMIIFKRRNGTSDWTVQHSGLPSANNLLYLNSTEATSTSGYGTIVAPTSTVFTVAWLTGMGVSGQTHVAYCFAPVDGYSNGFSYTGNGSTDGVFVNLGLRAKLLLIKRTDTTGNWYLWDTVRNTYNVVGEELYPNLYNAAATATDLDILSNGFKMRSTAADFNASGGTYVGFAWAEAPFAYSRAR